jgi:ABC-type multidrug transport system fused ATPase/permease subunit
MAGSAAGRAAVRAASSTAAGPWLATAALLVAAGGLAAGLAPLPLKAFIDRLSAGGSPTHGYLLPLAAYGLALLSQRICEQAQAYAYGRGELHLTGRFATLAFEHLLRLPLADHLGDRSGALAQTLTHGVLGLRLLLTHLVLSVLPVAVQLLVAAVVVGRELGMGPSLVLAAALVAYGLIFAFGLRRLAEPMRGIAASGLAAGGEVADSLMSIEALKAFTAEGRYVRRYAAALSDGEAQSRRYLRLRLENGLAIALVFVVAITSALGFGVMAPHRPGASPGAVVLLNAYLLQVVRPLEMLGFAARDIRQGLAYLGTLSALMARPSEPGVGSHPSPPATSAADLVFENVSLGFGDDRPILRDVSFRVRPGQTVALIGPSGAGKSSIARLTLGFLAPNAGHIRLDGRKISEIGLTELRRQIALVSQDTILLNDTLAANIALGADNPAGPEIFAAARAARLEELTTRLPLGLATGVGERGLKLSGGERQRVAIARALLKPARLIILDEATAALDPTTEQAVWRKISDLNTSRLIITHRLATIRHADEILLLDQGHIVARGQHASLLRTSDLYRRLWRNQDPEAMRAIGSA